MNLSSADGPYSVANSVAGLRVDLAFSTTGLPRVSRVQLEIVLIELARLQAENERLHGVEQRAIEKANAPRRLDGAASWVTASYILEGRA